MYLSDGNNGWICRDHSAEAFAETLQRAMLLSPAERKEMRHAARKEAERSFDFRNHKVLLNSFLKNVLAKSS